MAPLKSSLARSVSKLLGVSKDTDLTLRGDVQRSRRVPEPAIDASGGTKIDSSPTVHYHVFVSDSPFVVTTGGDADIFLVGGGGGSSTSLASGGGAGGAVHVTNTTLTSGVTYSVVVGAGGAEHDQPAPSSLTGNSGANSTFTHPGDSTVLTALGGGYGASYAQTNAANGGCGGGKEQSPDTGGLGQQPSQAQPFHTSHGGTLNQYGNDGNVASPPYGNFGGGGGGTGGGGSTSVTGGNAQPFSDFPAPVLAPAIPSGPVRTRWTSEVGPTGLFGGGGGGGARDGHTAGKGGTGGGGDGYNTTGQESSDGADYTGGGGGSGSYPFSSGENGKGGNGIVIIRYVDPT